MEMNIKDIPKKGFYDGKGLYKYADGDIYKLNYKNDLRDGQGTYIYRNGNKHERQWKEWKKHDVTSFINKNICSFQKKVKKRKIC